MVRKCISILLIIILPAAPIATAANQGTYAAGEPAFYSSIPIDLPGSFIRVEKFLPSANTQAPLIIHLQTAHGSYEAQQHLYETLKSLHNQYGIDLFMVEGSAVELKSGLLNFLPEDPAANQKLLRTLAQEGLVKAPELFLAEFPEVKTIGIEDQTAYRENLNAYLQFHSLKSDAASFMAQLKQDLLREAALRLSSEAREFLRQQLIFDEQIFSLDSWLESLKKAANNHLRIDLESPENQFDWPMLTRYFALKQLEKSLAGKDLQKEKELLPDIHMTDNPPGAPDFLSHPLMRFFAQQKSTPGKNPLTNLRAWFSLQFFSQEVSGSELHSEIQKLSEQLLAELIKNSPDGKVSELLLRYRLLKRLLTLAIDRDEWMALQKNKLAWRPAKQSWAKSYDAAFSFYDKATRREKPMGEKILGLVKTYRPRTAVVITGGFHTPFIQRMINQKKMPYLLASPVMTEAVENKIYENSIVETSLRQAPNEATMDTVPFFGIDSTSLINHGVSPRKVLAYFTAISNRVYSGDPKLQKRLQTMARERWAVPQSLRSEVRNTSSTRTVEHELKIADRVIYHYPEQGPNDPHVQIEALLTTLYGGDVQYYLGKNGTEFEQIRVDNSQGLLSLFNKNQSLTKGQHQRAYQLTDRAVKKLNALGIRVGHKVTLGDKQSTIGDIFTRDPRFESSFLHTFLGSRHQKLPNRTDKALAIEKAYRLKKAGKGQAAVINTAMEALEKKIRYYENIFQLKIPPIKPVPGNSNAAIETLQPYAARAQHNNDLGPFKGGIRFLFAYLLKGDAEFMELTESLIKAGLNLTEMRYFLRKYVREEVIPLALGMGSKAAAYKLPLGGGKGAVLMADFFLSPEGKIILEDMSEHYGGTPAQLRNWVIRNYARILFESGFIGPHLDIPAPDAGSRALDMNTMTDEVIRTWWNYLDAKQKSLLPAALKTSLDKANTVFILNPGETPFLKSVLDHLGNGKLNSDAYSGTQYRFLKKLLDLTATFTSKTVNYAGSEGREQSTGYGSVIALKKTLLLEIEKRGGGTKGLSSILGNRSVTSFNPARPLENLSAKIVGFGNAGEWLVRQLQNEGAIVTGISEGPLGVVFKPEGFTKDDINWLVAIKKAKGNFHSLDKDPEALARGVLLVSEQDFVEEPADLYVLAALQSAITTQNVKSAAGWIFLEIANGGITQEAYEELTQWAFVVTDTIANAGGVIASYYEWLQNTKGETWSEATVMEKLEKQMTTSIEKLSALQEELSKTLGEKVDWRAVVEINLLREIEAAEIKPPAVSSDIIHYAKPLKPSTTKRAPLKTIVRSELRSNAAGIVSLVRELPIPFVPLEVRNNPKIYRDVATSLFGDEVLGLNPGTWPSEKTARQAAVISPEKLRSKLGVKNSEAYIIGRGFAFDYGGAAILRQIIGSSPAVIITQKSEDIEAIKKLNKKLSVPVFTAGSLEQASQLISQSGSLGAARKVTGLLAVSDLDHMEMTGTKLKEDLNRYTIEWVVRSPEEFSSFLVQNHLQTLVDNFRQQLKVLASA